jgi:DNA-directed RNA polymerase subunit F
MSRYRHIIIFPLALMLPLSAQIVGQAGSADSVSTPDEKLVFQSGDMVQKQTMTISMPMVVVAKPQFHFIEGFASESSEQALLKHVEAILQKDPQRACEVVKEAIVISRADEDLVAKIVETACLVAPEMMRIIAQCAIAASPDSLHAIQQILAKLDPATGLLDGNKAGLEKGGIEDFGGLDPLMPLISPEPPVSPPDAPPPTPSPFPPTISPRPSSNNDR